MTASAPLSSPSAERNRQPMLEVLRRVLPGRGRALEIASGTGQHAAWFAQGLPGWRWQPTEADARLLASIAGWCAGLGNVEAPLRLDVLEAPWPVSGTFDAITCANMLHISPRACCLALMQGAGRLLAPDGVLVTYGPYIEDGVPTAASNLAFDADLRRRDPRWGLRLRSEVEAAAGHAGLRLRERVAMPANNLMLVFERVVPTLAFAPASS